MECQYCNVEFPKRLNLHEPYCKSNPNGTKRKSGPSVAWNKGKKFSYPKYWKDRFPNEKIFVENSTFPRHSVKSRILLEELIEYRCSICGTDPEWQGKPMPLILDHINGVNNDNRLTNLRFVCSNCDSQLPTYKSKNRKN